MTLLFSVIPTVLHLLMETGLHLMGLYIVAGTAVSGFTSNTGSTVVRLRRIAGDPPEGIYHCSIEDDIPSFQTLYVGLYNSGGGIAKI